MINFWWTRIYLIPWCRAIFSMNESLSDTMMPGHKLSANDGSSDVIMGDTFDERVFLKSWCRAINFRWMTVYLVPWCRAINVRWKRVYLVPWYRAINLRDNSCQTKSAVLLKHLFKDSGTRQFQNVINNVNDCIIHFVRKQNLPKKKEIRNVRFPGNFARVLKR